MSPQHSQAERVDRQDEHTGASRLDETLFHLCMKEMGFLKRDMFMTEAYGLGFPDQGIKPSTAYQTSSAAFLVKVIASTS